MDYRPVGMRDARPSWATPVMLVASSGGHLLQLGEASETAREIERAGGGVLVAPEQPGELADAITDLQRESERAVALGTNAGRDADATLKKDEALRAYERFVEHAAPSCRRPSDDSALD